MKEKGVVETYLACIGDYICSHFVCLLVILFCLAAVSLLFYGYTRLWNRTWATEHWKIGFCYAVVLAVVSFFGISAWLMSEDARQFESNARVTREDCQETAKELIRRKDVKCNIVDGDAKDVCRLQFRPEKDSKERLGQCREVLKRLVVCSRHDVRYLSDLDDVAISDAEVKKLGETVFQVFGELNYSEENLARLTESVKETHNRFFKETYDKAFQSMSSPWEFLIICYILIGSAVHFHCRKDIVLVDVQPMLKKYEEG